MSALQVLTRPLGGAALAQDAMEGRVPSGWYRPRPTGPEGWRTYLDEVRAEFSAREWLAALSPAIEASGAAAERLARSADGAGVVVTTGQQPGLFGGPIYTWSKALSALALADELEAATGVPVAPVFWAATDDADFAEASVTYVAVPGGVETLTLAPPEVSGASMRDTPLGDVSALLDRLELGAGSAAGAGILQMTRDAYAPRETVGSAYLRLLRSLLEPLGIAVLDAAHPAVRAASRPLVVRALECGAEIDAQLQRRFAAIREAGYAPQVAHVPALSLVHETVQGKRRRVPLAAARASATGRDGDLGPNVLLRPVVERGILPTVAYVAGPGELAYFAQVSAVAGAVGSPVPLVLPRWSGLVLEPHIERILQRRSIGIDELRDPHAVETRLAREQLPPALRSLLAEWRGGLERSAGVLREVIGEAAPPLLSERVIAGAEHDMTRRLERLERRAVAAVKRRQGDLLRDVATARAALWPLGKPQERMLTIIPLLARHGPGLLRMMLERTRGHAARLVAVPRAVHATAHAQVGDRR
jgi:bacillithiol biosynthesis cysteine-adding enzyme BshC